MPLIKNGTEIEDVWAFVPDEVDLEPGGCITVSLQRFLGEGAELFLRNEAVGVRLQPEDNPEALEPWLDRLTLVEISFPKYTDGRGFSQAQLLRRRFRYAGELRAVGDVLRDQILYMNRSGFDAYLTSRAALPSVVEALGDLSAVYQPAADDRTPVYKARTAKG
ncbi:MAG: DUF934 domain-containing protein [Pseudomonadota bacterium]